jgi:hypothetical protein
MNLLTIIGYARHADTLVAFIEGRELYDAVAVVGDIEVDAALYALKGARSAKKPREYIVMTVAHLQSAHIAFRKNWKSKDTLVGRNSQWLLMGQALDKDMWVCAIMAICERYLGNPVNAREALSMAREALNAKDRLFSGSSDDDSTSGFLKEMLFDEARVLLGMLNPAFWRQGLGEIYLGKDYSTDHLAISRQDLDELARVLDCC